MGRKLKAFGVVLGKPFRPGDFFSGLLEKPEWTYARSQTIWGRKRRPWRLGILEMLTSPNATGPLPSCWM